MNQEKMNMSYAKEINAIKINISDIEEKEMDKVLREIIAENMIGTNIDKSKLDTLAIFIKVRMKMFIEGLIIQIK